MWGEGRTTLSGRPGVRRDDLGGRAPTARHLWNSYNVAIAAISKTYAPGGTSQPSNLRGCIPEIAPQLIQRNTLAPERAEVASRKTGATRSIVMWDLVMLALGLGFFAAAIGYSYACERL
jgi:hypothetical protein